MLIFLPKGQFWPSPAGAVWGYLDAQCSCTLQKKFTTEKLLPALVQSGTCDSGPDIASFSLLSAGSLECQEERGRGVCVLFGALGCRDGPLQVTQAV